MVPPGTRSERDERQTKTRRTPQGPSRVHAPRRHERLEQPSGPPARGVAGALHRFGRGTHHPPGLALLALGALGVVYGDIGTSPLYAFRESFRGAGHRMAVTDANVLGVLSLIVWSLLIVITVKYLAFVMRADNEGEGGILSLTSLLFRNGARATATRWSLVLLGLFGTALLYGDGMITPAISVLAAVEGGAVAAPDLQRWVVPASVLILVALFALQSRGTARVGALFGPVMIVWFATLAVLGAGQVLREPSVLAAVNPLHAVRFFADHGLAAFLSLGSVFLVVTGGEALYADMGHFGRGPIQLGWFALVLPSLLLNYFGQGALLLTQPEAITHPFYRLVPAAGVLPLVLLATVATVIASQALISGVFSLTMQAVQLDYAPRVRVKHTSPTAFGQIYVPAVNWALMLACIGLVLGFRSSTSLAAAYGLAVTSTMVITTLLFAVVLHDRFHWSRPAAWGLCAVFLGVEVGFFGANVFKIPHGGWFPLVVGAAVFTLLTTWHTGRQLVRDRIRRGEESLSDFLRGHFDAAEPPPRIRGAAVYLFGDPDSAPPALVANLRHNGVLHERVVILAVLTDRVPRVASERRTVVRDRGHGVHSVQLHYGFMEDPDVPQGLKEGAAAALELDPERTTYFLGGESLHVTHRPGMAVWREHLFAAMVRNATSAADYFCLPAARTITVGVQVEL